MHRRSWKRSESRIASLVGGERVPVSGRGRGDNPDIAHDWLSPEVKSQRTLPLWLRTAMVQAMMAKRDGQLPVVILHESGRRHDQSIVCIRLSDFVEWFGGSPPAVGEE